MRAAAARADQTGELRDAVNVVLAAGQIGRGLVHQPADQFLQIGTPLLLFKLEHEYGVGLGHRPTSQRSVKYATPVWGDTVRSGIAGP